MNSYNDERSVCSKSDSSMPSYPVGEGPVTLRRRVQTSDGRVRTRKVDVYLSNIGGYIRDAETGDRMPHRVGSLDEDLYFKVAISNGECAGRKSNIAFFHSASHYAHYTFSDVNPEVEEEWRFKRADRLQELARAKEEAQRRTALVR